MPDRESALLAIPKICADKIITLYHSSLFAGHQGVIKMYLNIGDKFFYTRSYILPTFIHQGMPHMSISKE